MQRPHLEVADVLRLHGSRFLEHYGHKLSGSTRQVLEALLRCGTGLLGTHLKKCTHCRLERLGANTCRNRHCPKCQTGRTAKWVAQRAQEVLNTSYFHIVFTLPRQFNKLFLANKAVVGEIFFRAVKETLLEIGASEKYLGAEIGFCVVLHSWGQNLQLHPHLHCLVSGGGLAFDEDAWVEPDNPRYFAPTAVLSTVFRGKFIDYLKQAFYGDKLSLQGELCSLSTPACFESYLSQSCKKRWIVECREPFATPLNVIKYLGRYVFRTAISNRRLLSIDNDRVRFRYKDYRSGKQRTLSLDAIEFIRRFLMHIVPRQFTRIRYYGFLSPGKKKQALAKARRILGQPDLSQLSDYDSQQESIPVTAPSGERCSICRLGFMQTIAVQIPALFPPLTGLLQPAGFDSS